jgi:nucleotide-binding universal stress UspA family protein
MRIVVALDGSEKGDAAVASAAKLAEATGAEVLLVNVFSPWVDPASPMPRIPGNGSKR